MFYLTKNLKKKRCFDITKKKLIEKIIFFKINNFLLIKPDLSLYYYYIILTFSNFFGFWKRNSQLSSFRSFSARKPQTPCNHFHIAHKNSHLI